MELKVSDLAVSRGGLVVLEGLDFALAPGQALVLRGPHGIGKIYGQEKNITTYNLARMTCCCTESRTPSSRYITATR